MTRPVPSAQVMLDDLSLHEGGLVLVRRGLASLSAGEWLEVVGLGPNLKEDLAVWCRKEGYSFSGGNGTRVHKIQRRTPPPTDDTAKNNVVEVALPTWGIAPRGAKVEIGGPTFSFTLRRKRDVWGDELDSIYSQAINNQWSVARDIAWNSLPRLSEEVEEAVCQVMTFLTENELAAWYVPARFISRIHPHFREVIEVLSMQVVDEARHASAFVRRAEETGKGLGTTANSSQLSLQTLLEEPDFTSAMFLLCVMGEGTFLTLLRFIETNAPDPVTGALMRLAHRDEARHVAFGVSHIRYVLHRAPEIRSSLIAAVERRSRILASISGLSPYVHDALVIIAGGGTSTEKIRQGSRLVKKLHREMDHARQARLTNLGFDAETALRLSAYHTKNFM